VESFKKVLGQTSWQILGKIVTSVLTLLTLSLITRTYGASGTGLYTLLITYLSFFYLMVDGGFNGHFLAHFSEQSPKQLFGHLLGLRLVLAVVLALIAIALLPLMPFADANFSLMVMLGAVTILGFAVFVSCNAFFQYHLLYQYSVFATILSAFTSIGLVVWIINSHLPLPYLVIPQVIGWLVCALASLFFVRLILRSLTFAFDLHFLQKAFWDVWPITLTLVANTRVMVYG
jgi:O-antigen/teichoic acid export membrane protein